MSGEDVSVGGGEVEADELIAGIEVGRFLEGDDGLFVFFQVDEGVAHVEENCRVVRLQSLGVFEFVLSNLAVFLEFLDRLDAMATLRASSSPANQSLSALARHSTASAAQSLQRARG